jgi:hypothetical protein
MLQLDSPRPSGFLIPLSCVALHMLDAALLRDMSGGAPGARKKKPPQKGRL